MDLRVERLHGNGELVLAELEAVWFYEWVADAAHGVGERFGVLEEERDLCVTRKLIWIIRFVLSGHYEKK